MDKVYFIKNPHNKLVKIGKSRDVNTRLRQLRKVCGPQLELLGVTDQYSEEELHDKFIVYRV
jgi:hypothetical protein